MEYTRQLDTEIQTGERETELFTPEDRELFDDAYDVLTKLIILGNELHNGKLVVACDNLQQIIDEL